MNSYELTRALFDWGYDNPDLITPNHIALYCFAIEHCNRLGWKEKFGLPSGMAMDAIGIKSYRTYIKAFNDLVEWGFIKVIQLSKNQYSSNIIALSKNTKANTKALDKALQKHRQKQEQKHCNSTGKSKASIDKHITLEPINQEPLNKGSETQIAIAEDKPPLPEKKEKEKFSPKFLEAYFDWFIEKNQMAPVTDAAGGKAIKEIAAYLIAETKRSHPEWDEGQIETSAIEGWRMILKRWDKIEPFLQKQTKLVQIRSNLQNIITQIKNPEIVNNGTNRQNNRKERIDIGSPGYVPSWERPDFLAGK